MQNRSDIAGPGVGEIIRQRLAEMGISQTELAARVGEHYQTISAIINGKREATIALSVRIDEVLDFSPGTVALAQTRHQISKELKECQADNMREKRQAILARIKANGGFWSYDGIPDRLDDDAVIEAALVHLDLEDLPLLLGLWSKAHIKRVWKDRDYPASACAIFSFSPEPAVLRRRRGRPRAASTASFTTSRRPWSEPDLWNCVPSTSTASHSILTSRGYSVSAVEGTLRATNDDGNDIVVVHPFWSEDYIYDLILRIGGNPTPVSVTALVSNTVEG